MNRTSPYSLEALLRPQFRQHSKGKNEYNFLVAGAQGERIVTLRIQTSSTWFGKSPTGKLGSSPILLAMSGQQGWPKPYSPVHLATLMNDLPADSLALAVATPIIVAQVEAFLEELCSHMEALVRGMGRHAFHGQEVQSFIARVCEKYSAD